MTREITAESFDYSKLKGRIVELFGNQNSFAKAMNQSSVTVSKKLTGKSEWSQIDITDACYCLGINFSDIPIYFFSFKS